MDVLYIPDSPIRPRRYAVRENLIDHHGMQRRIIRGHYSLQPVRIVRWALRREGLTNSELERVIEVAERYPYSVDDLAELE